MFTAIISIPLNSSIWETIPHILHGHGTLTNWSPKCTLYIAIIPMDLDLEGCEFLPNLYSLQFSIRFRKPVSPNITQKKTTFPVALLSRKQHTDTHTQTIQQKSKKNRTYLEAFSFRSLLFRADQVLKVQIGICVHRCKQTIRVDVHSTCLSREVLLCDHNDHEDGFLFQV